MGVSYLLVKSSWRNKKVSPVRHMLPRSWRPRRRNGPARLPVSAPGSAASLGCCDPGPACWSTVGHQGAGAWGGPRGWYVCAVRCPAPWPCPCRAQATTGARPPPQTGLCQGQGVCPSPRPRGASEGRLRLGPQTERGLGWTPESGRGRRPAGRVWQAVLSLLPAWPFISAAPSSLALP